jgi:hypothetical protein
LSASFLFGFQVFSIGYGPTPSKRKDIVLKQIMKGFELILHRKKESFLRKVFSLQNEWESISKLWHIRSYNVLHVQEYWKQLQTKQEMKHSRFMK